MSAFERFWLNVDIRDQRECWNWTGTTDNQGYGIPDAGIQIAYGEPLSHRVACTMMQPRSAQDSDVLHSCDNPTCCNPRHLRWGTKTENSHDKRLAAWASDAVTARRDGRPPEEGDAVVIRSGWEPSKIKRGLRRLNANMVSAIRSDYEGGMSPRDIAAKYGLTQSHADSVAKRRIWRHVA